MSAALTATDLRFINSVAARRFAGGEAAEPDPSAIEEALAARSDVTTGTAFARAAQLVAILVQRGAFEVAPLHTALLVLHCSLSLDGLQLLAPQGVLAGMMKDIGGGGDPQRLSRWLEDRAVPSSGSG